MRECVSESKYGVATISRLFKIIDLFCTRALQREDILQKKPITLRSLQIVATPYERSWEGEGREREWGERKGERQRQIDEEREGGREGERESKGGGKSMYKRDTYKHTLSLFFTYCTPLRAAPTSRCS